MITQNAKTLIGIIGAEYQLQTDRMRKGFIATPEILPFTLERLKAKAKTNVDLKIFLETLAYIPQVEDEGLDYPWAEDPREANDNIVSQGTTLDYEQRLRDDDLGRVPASVHTVPRG